MLSRTDFKLKIHMMLNDLFQAQCFRSSICYSEHIHTESIFQTGLFIEHIFQIFHICAFFQLQNDPDTFFGRLVGNIHNICSFF